MKNVDAASLIRDRKVASFLVGDSAFLDAISRLAPRDFFSFHRSGDGTCRHCDGYTEAPYRSYKQATKNNAEVFFLNASSSTAVRRYAYVGRASHICIPLNATLMLPLTLWGLARYVPRKQLTYEGVLTVEGASRPHRHWLVYRTSKKKFIAGARCYYSPTDGFDELFGNIGDLDYCILRWHERLAELPENEDLDILVSDEDADRLRAVLDRKIGTRPMDLYSASGGEQANLGGIACYPPHLANQILSNLGSGPYGSKIPKPDVALQSFVYHILYHKGPKAGVESALVEVEKTSRFRDELLKRARAAGVDIQPTMESLAGFLHGIDWVPPRDMLSRYSVTNAWVKAYYFDGSRKALPAGLAVCLIRELAEAHDDVGEIVEALREEGFEILEQRRLDPAERAMRSKSIRGGNWGKGGDPVSAGLPAYALVVHDANPIKPDKKTIERYPLLDNQRILAKHRIRDRINRNFPASERTNIIHTSDNTEEALEYIKILMPDRLADYEARFAGTSGMKTEEA